MQYIMFVLKNIYVAAYGDKSIQYIQEIQKYTHVLKLVDFLDQIC